MRVPQQLIPCLNSRFTQTEPGAAEPTDSSTFLLHADVVDGSGIRHTNIQSSVPLAGSADAQEAAAAAERLRPKFSLIVSI